VAQLETRGPLPPSLAKGPLLRSTPSFNVWLGGPLGRRTNRPTWQVPGGPVRPDMEQLARRGWSINVPRCWCKRCVRAARSMYAAGAVSVCLMTLPPLLPLCCIVTLVNLPCLATQSREMNPLFNGCFITMQLRRKAAVMPLCRSVCMRPYPLTPRRCPYVVPIVLQNGGFLFFTGVYRNSG